MKLEGCTGGALYGSSGRTILRERESGSFEAVGSLPSPDWRADGLRRAVETTRPWKSAAERLVGAFPTTNVWRLGSGGWLATAGDRLFASHDGGGTWRASRRLPRSSGTAGVLPSAVCHHDGVTDLGEYPLDPDATPRVLRSTDGGRTWETLLSLPSVRHVHAVQVDPVTGERWVTTGDTDEACRIGRIRDGTFEPVGGGSQAWRAVELVFTEAAVMWGMDCAYADENRIFALDRENVEGGPESLHAVSGSVYYGESIEIGGTTWAAFSTAVEVGADASAPDETTTVRPAKVVAASAETGFSTWHEITTYRKRTRPVDRLDGWLSLPSANAYVFLASDPDLGLFFNPYNTATDHGRVLRIPPERFERLE